MGMVPFFSYEFTILRKQPIIVGLFSYISFICLITFGYIIVIVNVGKYIIH